jgi:protease PrsW
MNEIQAVSEETQSSREPRNSILNKSARLSSFWEDIASFRFDWIVPYKTAVSKDVLRNPSTWGMLLFSFAPLAFNGAVSSVEQIPFFLATYAPLAWAAYFYVFVVKRSTNLWLGLASAAFTIAVGVPIVLLLRRTLLSVFYSMSAAPSGIEHLLGYLVSSLSEELFKALPLLILGFILGWMKKPADGIFYGALSGLGFSAVESYRIFTRTHDTDYVMQVLLRATACPFLHALWASISGYFIALATMSRRRVALCLLGLTTAFTVHGCYDAAPRSAQAVLAGLSYLLFISYIRRSDGMVLELEKAESARVVSG